MNKLRLIAGVILVFLVGALAGSLGTGLYLKHSIENSVAGGPPPRLKKVLLIRRLSNELDLTEAQCTEIEKIVKEAEMRIFAIRRKYLPEIREITDQSFALMKEKLNPDQTEKLEKLHAKLRDRHARAFIRSIQIETTTEQVLSKIRDRLNLTEDQETGIRPVIEQVIGQRKSIVEKYKDQQHPDIFSLGHEMQELERSVEQRLSEILTKEQIEEYRKIWEEERFEIRSKIRKRKFGASN